MKLIWEVTRVFVCLFFFSYASWKDLKDRRVTDTVWMIFAPVAFVLTFLHIYFYQSWQFPWYGFCLGLTAAFAVVLFYSGAFGGADSKALMCLALALPFPPTNLFPPLFQGVSQIFFPLTVFSNSVVLAASTAVYMLMRNLFWHQKTNNQLFEGEQKGEFWGRKLLVLATGYRVPIERLKEKWHLYPLEDVVPTQGEGIKRELILLPKDEGREEIVQRLSEAVESGKIENSIWATPGLPMLVFLTAGLIIGLLFGDIVWTSIHLLLG